MRLGVSSGFSRLRSRLASGRPLVVDADASACFRARGVAIDSPGAVGQLLRSRPSDVLEHHRGEVQSHVSIVTALTQDTTPRALAEVGMEHRSAWLTGIAIELCKYNAVDIKLLVEPFRDVYGLLSCHSVGYEKNFMGLDRFDDLHELGHQFFIDLQPARSV